MNFTIDDLRVMRAIRDNAGRYADAAAALGMSENDLRNRATVVACKVEMAEAR